MIKLLFPYTAALMRYEGLRTIVVADLHIGWEIALSQEGIHVPSQTPKLLKRLIEVVLKHRADKLLILGDVKHTVATAKTPEWRDIPEFFTALRRHVNEVLVVRGNHDGNIDPLLPENVKVLPSTGVVMGDVGFFHGHRWPSPDLLDCKTLMMGHVHPVVVLRDPAGFKVTRQVWMKADYDGLLLRKILERKYRTKEKREQAETLHKSRKPLAKYARLFVVPSFNDFLGGRPLNEGKSRFSSERIAGPVLRSEAVDLRNAETYLLDGTYLGTLRQLKALG